MAIIITDECINCGACESECPNTAIYEASDSWKYSDGTKSYDVMTWEYVVDNCHHFFNMKSAWKFVYRKIRRS